MRVLEIKIRDYCFIFDFLFFLLHFRWSYPQCLRLHASAFELWTWTLHLYFSMADADVNVVAFAALHSSFLAGRKKIIVNVWRESSNDSTLFLSSAERGLTHLGPLLRGPPRYHQQNSWSLSTPFLASTRPADEEPEDEESSLSSGCLRTYRLRQQASEM